MGCFSISFLNTTYLIRHKLTGKKGPALMTTVALKLMIVVCHLFFFNWVATEGGSDPTLGCDFW